MSDAQEVEMVVIYILADEKEGNELLTKKAMPNRTLETEEKSIQYGLQAIPTMRCLLF